MHKILIAITAAFISTQLVGIAPAADPSIRIERVKFAQGSASVVIKGRLKGHSDMDYMVHAAARRNESSNYTLTISVTGKALVAVPASQDAVLAGTRFHASTKINCVPYIEKFRGKKPQECEAFVIRRGFDGTATVEIPQMDSYERLILFVKGRPVAADSQDPMSFPRKNDVAIVAFDADEFTYQPRTALDPT
jgi:hypothetical protein